jgi:hypothetical protein
LAHLTDVSDRSDRLAFVVVKRTVPGRATVLAWAGTQQDLMSLVEMVQKAFQEAREAAKGKLDEQRAELESHDFSPSAVENMLKSQVEADRQSWRPQASYFALHGGEHGSGPLDEVLATTVLSDLERLYIRYPGLWAPSERVVQLWFTRTGTWCEVEGEDAVWVASMAHSVQQHFNRRRPRWAWLHSQLGFFVRFYFVLAALFAFIYPAVRSLKIEDRPTAYAIATAITGILTLATLGLVNSRALNRLLPRFEILPDGKTATGTRRLAWFVTLVLGGALSTYAAWYISA